MLFTTGGFAIFLLIVLAVVRSGWVDGVWRKLFLLLASYYFYATLEWWFVVLLVASSAFNFAWGRLYSRLRADTLRRLWLIGGVLGNLALLGYFKYAGFLLENVSDLSRAFGYEGAGWTVNVLLPVGISFFTFQNLCYLLDIRRGETQPSDSALDYFLYLAFFPQLLSGPIVRPNYFLSQLQEPWKADAAGFQSGLQLALLGFCKKVFLADVIGTQLVNPAFSQPEAYHPLFLLLALYGFTIQLYLDLSGYTDMARGFARMMGYDLPKNFDRPYTAASVGNFWQRWHITMSSFFRDYLFFALGGSRYGNVYFNVVVTFVAIGIWHDAGWNYVVYGLCHGGMVAFERYRVNRRRARGLPPVELTGWSYLWRVVFVFHFVSFTRVLFRGDSFADAYGYLAAMLAPTGSAMPMVWMAYAAMALAMIAHYTPVDWRDRLHDGFRRLPSALQAGVGAALIYAGVAVTYEQAAFLYFQY
jgi:D-alanyl-lipoteichoic acid acyltransferase DltB (MBOAT superfamily)